MTIERQSETRQRFNVLDRFIRSIRSRRIRSQVESTDVVLDFGCGQENWFLRSSSKAISAGIGIDPHLNLNFDPDLQPPNIQAKRCTIAEFGNETSTQFDVVTWLAVIEHFHSEEAETFLSTCASLLKPNGRIVLTTPTPRSKPILEFLAYKLHFISEDEIRDHKIYYNKRKMETVLQRSGFRMTKYQTFQFGFNSLIVATRARAVDSES